MASQVSLSTESLRQRGSWEHHLNVISTSSKPPCIPPFVTKVSYISLKLGKEEVKTAWEKTKRTDFFVNAAFPLSVVQSIDDQINAHFHAMTAPRKSENSLPRRKPELKNPRSWTFGDYADCVVDMLTMPYLWRFLAPFEAGWVSGYKSTDFLDHRQCELRCIVLRDVVAHANGIKTYNTYPKEWYQPWSEAALPPLPCTMTENPGQIVGEKRKNLEGNINSTGQSPKRKHPRVSITATPEVVELDVAQETEIPATRATSVVREHSIIQELKLKSANLLSSIGPQPTDQDLEAKLTPLDIDTTNEDWQAQLTAKVAHNKMETRIHQLLKDQHTEKARLMEGLTNFFIEGITHLVETQQEQRLEAAAGKEKDAEYWLNLLNSATTSRGTGNSE
ncbi:hypothetical protein F5X68DRAFT_230204 [Plectosphaerella plurivora]|uniref:Uncharacterized protein n=1 Tax=Plectosphaerella plurivora TaxID=936078 RepID=A0A9P9AE95_9PEZI|nr:hypothetical protein F5X68DRAFT_230204 [Plectosphaerella plurivora]